MLVMFVRMNSMKIGGSGRNERKMSKNEINPKFGDKSIKIK